MVGDMFFAIMKLLVCSASYLVPFLDLAYLLVIDLHMVLVCTLDFLDEVVDDILVVLQLVELLLFQVYGH